MKKLVSIFLFVIGFGIVIWWRQGNEIPSTGSDVGIEISPQQKEIEIIRSFMGNPDLELTFVNTDLPVQYFRVGKVTQIGNGENMEAVEGWTRQVNVYDQKELINGTCSIYEYNTDVRNNSLTAVIIRGLRQSEIEDLKNSSTPCNPNSENAQKLAKTEAETIAMSYLKRALANFDQIKAQFIYLQQVDGAHEWFWEDNEYKLPDGLSSRPYLKPIIRISVYNDSQIQYWNTTSLFEEMDNL